MKKTREQVAEAYRSEPWWYDLRGFFILTFAYNSSLPRQIRFFGSNVGLRHLEVACGTGTLMDMMFKWRRWKKLPPAQTVGIDYAPSMLAGARYRFSGTPDFEFLHADVGELPFESGSFDSANIANAVHCFPEVDAGLREVCRVLRPGGVLAANVLLFPRGVWPFGNIANRINRWGVAKGILVTPYEEADIRQRIVSAGFEILSEAVSGNCYEVRACRPASASR